MQTRNDFIDEQIAKSLKIARDMVSKNPDSPATGIIQMQYMCQSLFGMVHDLNEKNMELQRQINELKRNSK